MAEKHLRKCSTALAMREMQIKMTLRFHLTLFRMAKINNTCDAGNEDEQGNLSIAGSQVLTKTVLTTREPA